jgi:hypothetical protein
MWMMMWSGVSIVQAATRQLGGRSFVVGEAVKTGHPREWRAGKVVWIPVDEITQMVEFESADALRELYGNGKRSLLGKLFSPRHPTSQDTEDSTEEPNPSP